MLPWWRQRRSWLLLLALLALLVLLGVPVQGGWAAAPLAGLQLEGALQLQGGPQRAAPWAGVSPSQRAQPTLPGAARRPRRALAGVAAWALLAAG